MAKSPPWLSFKILNSPCFAFWPRVWHWSRWYSYPWQLWCSTEHHIHRTRKPSKRDIVPWGITKPYSWRDRGWWTLHSRYLAIFLARTVLVKVVVRGALNASRQCALRVSNSDSTKTWIPNVFLIASQIRSLFIFSCVSLIPFLKTYIRNIFVTLDCEGNIQHYHLPTSNLLFWANFNWI